MADRGPEPGHLAVVTETGPSASVTQSAGQIWAELAWQVRAIARPPRALPRSRGRDGEETLDLVLIGADGSPRWSRVWPTPEEHPRHAGLELWMAVHGHQIVSRTASQFDWCQDKDD